MPRKPNCELLGKKFRSLAVLKVNFGNCLSKLPGEKHLWEEAKRFQDNLKMGLRFFREHLRVSPEEAREIMGQNFLGKEAVEKTFKFKLKQEDTPPIPFSRGELEKAFKLGQYLNLKDRQNSGWQKPDR